MKLSLSSFTKRAATVKATAQSFKAQSPKDIKAKGLLGYQVPAAFHLARSLATYGSAVDASDTGTGKTYVGSAVARELKRRPLVLCPKITVPEWKRVLKSFGVDFVDVLSYEKVRAGNTPWLKWFKGQPTRRNGRLVPTTIPRWTVPDDTLLILDEAHRCKAQESQNSKMMIEARTQGIYILPMSATLATSPLEMRALGYVLGLHNLTNYSEWARNHGAESNAWGGLAFDATDARNKAIMFALHKQIFPNRGYRIRIDDLGDAFPKTQIAAVAVAVEDTDKLNAVYDNLVDALSALDERAAGYSQSTFALLLEARQRAELIKASAFVEMALDALEDGCSPIIFVNFIPTMDLILDSIAKRYKGSVAVIRGQQKEDVRDAEVTAFQNNEARVMVANIAAGGTGTNLHDIHGGHPRYAIISPNYSAVQMKQAFGRPWRQGGKTPSIQRVVFAAETIEEQACEAVRRKIGNLNLLNDGDLTAGINF